MVESVEVDFFAEFAPPLEFASLRALERLKLADVFFFFQSAQLIVVPFLTSLSATQLLFRFLGLVQFVLQRRIFAKVELIAAFFVCRVQSWIAVFQNCDLKSTKLKLLLCKTSRHL